MPMPAQEDSSHWPALAQVAGILAGNKIWVLLAPQDKQARPSHLVQVLGSLTLACIGGVLAVSGRGDLQGQGQFC